MFQPSLVYVLTDIEFFFSLNAHAIKKYLVADPTVKLKYYLLDYLNISVSDIINYEATGILSASPITLQTSPRVISELETLCDENISMSLDRRTTL